MAEKFRLVITGADEDSPRLITAYGRACGGEITLVYRPREGEALLVHQVKKQPARYWRTIDGEPPLRPNIEIAPAEAVQMLKRIKAGPPPRATAMLRGSWNGWLTCNEQGVELVLERKLTSYGVLRIAGGSGSGKRWTATFERAERWFSSAKAKNIERASLGEAIKAGYAEAQGLVAEACTTRDTHRRGALDPTHAAKHPPKPAREKKDPTERYQPQPEKKPRGGKKDAAPPAAKAAAAPKPAAPKAAAPKKAPAKPCNGGCTHAGEPPKAPKAEAKPPAKAKNKKSAEIDPAKDQMLMSMVTAGIKQAALELGLGA